MHIDRRRVLAGLAAAVASTPVAGIMPAPASASIYAPVLDHGLAVAPVNPARFSGADVWHFHARDAEQWAIRHIATGPTFIRVPFGRTEHAMRLTRQSGERDINRSRARRAAFNAYARGAFDVAAVTASHVLSGDGGYQGAVLVAVVDGTFNWSGAPLCGPP